MKIIKIILCIILLCLICWGTHRVQKQNTKIWRSINLFNKFTGGDKNE